MDLNNILETAEDKYFDVCSKTLTALKHCLNFYIYSRYLIFRSYTNKFINQNFVIHLIFILTTTVYLKSRYLDKIYHIIEAWFIYILFVTIVTRMNIMQMLTWPRVLSREYHSCPPPSWSPTPPQTSLQTRSCRYCCPG